MQRKNDSAVESDDDNLPESHDAEIEGNNNKAIKTISSSPTSKPTSNQNKDESSNSPSESSPSGAKAIKARGTYYPLTAFPTSMPQGPVMRKEDESPSRTEAASGKKSIFCCASTNNEY